MRASQPDRQKRRQTTRQIAIQAKKKEDRQRDQKTKTGRHTMQVV